MLMAAINKTKSRLLLAKKIVIIGSTVLILGAVSTITPIFANIGAALLSLYSTLSLDNIDKADSIIVLGGGLTRDSKGAIALNHYSQSRANQTIISYQNQPATIITSGVESPWINDYLQEKLNNQAQIITENASMNTCENARFSAKLLTHYQLPKTAYLITDRYHMARARRQFAQAGIATVATPADLAIPLNWLTPRNNLVHTRRTIYEIVALARDIIVPQVNCRSSEQVSIEQLHTPRRQAKLF